MITGSSSNGPWQVSGSRLGIISPTWHHLRSSPPAGGYACTQPGETRHATTAAVVPVGGPHAPIPPGPSRPGRRAAPDTRPGRTSPGTFSLVRGVYSNPIRSRERRFESCRGALVRVINSNTLTILVRHEPEPVTCGNADTFRTLSPARPRKQDPSRASPAQRRNLTTATRPLPCPQAVALPPIYAATQRQPDSAAISGGGCPARPTAAEAIGPTSHTPSQAVRILTRLIRSGADAGDPRCCGRMCRHARPRPAVVQTEAVLARMGSRMRQGLSGGRAGCDDGFGDQYHAMQGLSWRR